ncbi:MAG: Bug family tripartite tricarboxylate transporter substrate binding protein [Xanthobacteraceae bacterium]
MGLMPARRIFVSVLAAFASLSLSQAQDLPNHPIKMIVPFTPGSPVDVVARLVAQRLPDQLNQPVVIDNRPGAGTTIGMTAAALADPDGATLLFQSSSLLVARAMYKNLDYDPLTRFVPVANVAWGSWVTVVPPSLPVHSAQELIAYARAHPGELNFGYGQGTAPQLVGEWFHRSNDLKIAGVPYKGGAQAITDVLGGTIQINIGTTTTLVPLIREGRLRAIAQWGATREPELPDVPTMIESGFPGLSLGFWVGLWAPAGMPPSIVARLNAATNAALVSPEMKASFKALGLEPRPGSPQDFSAFIADETPKWQRIVEASGVQVE